MVGGTGISLSLFQALFHRCGDLLGIAWASCVCLWQGRATVAVVSCCPPGPVPTEGKDRALGSSHVWTGAAKAVMGRR